MIVLCFHGSLLYADLHHRKITTLIYLERLMEVMNKTFRNRAGHLDEDVVDRDIVEQDVRIVRASFWAMRYICEGRYLLWDEDLMFWREKCLQKYCKVRSNTFFRCTKASRKEMWARSFTAIPVIPIILILKNCTTLCSLIGCLTCSNGMQKVC